MYRGSSPIFDVPEFPVLRRVKPLPKRRRTSLNTTLPDADVVVGSVPVGNGILLPPSLEGLVMPGPDATPEELLAHADQLSARITLSSYYMPMLGAAPDFLNSAAAAMAAVGLDQRKGFSGGGKERPREILFHGPGDVGDNESEEGMIVRGEGEGAELVPHDEDPEDAHSQSYTESNVTLSDVDLTTASLDYGLGYPIPGVRTSSGGARGTGAEVGIITSREDDDDHGDGDMEHLQQPGNTKKRKVPANISSSPREHDSGPIHVIVPDDSIEQNGLSTGSDGRLSKDYDTTDSSSSYYATTLSLLAQKKSKLTAATLAGLQHKEMLKTRKRQLAAVLGALSHGDTLALDQALSANYPISSSGLNDFNHSSKIRLSKRRVLRVARALRQARKKQKPPNKTRVQIPSREFTFMCPSETADRLIATKEEVDMLRNRFEAELARQAAKAAKLAAASKLMTYPPSKSGKSKRTQHAKQQQSQQHSQHQPQPQQQRRRTSNRGGTNRVEDQGASTMKGTTTVGTGAINVGSERRQNLGVNMTASSEKEQLQHAPSTAMAPTAASTSTARQAPSEAVDHPSLALNVKPTRGKKKKRSALANASNPHHLKNYVPSRLPHPGSSNYHQLQQTGYNSNWISPLSLRFLMADIPPRKPYANPQQLPPPSSAAVNGRGKKTSNGTQSNTAPLPSQYPPSNNAVYGTYTTNLLPLTNPADEWICAFCEYELFYGDEVGYRRAIRNRKKILKRRRRARERAAAAASGAGLHSAHHGAVPPPTGSAPIGGQDVVDDAEYNTQANDNRTINNGYTTTAGKGHGVDDEEYELEGDEGYDPIQPDGVMSTSNSTKRKGDPNKERERERTAYG